MYTCSVQFVNTASDYISQPLMATFHSGEIHSTNLTVEILEDAVLEGSEHFTLHFTLPEGYENLAAGQVDTAVVTIQDNDRK